MGDSKSVGLMGAMTLEWVSWLLFWGSKQPGTTRQKVKFSCMTRTDYSRQGQEQTRIQTALGHEGRDHQPTSTHNPYQVYWRMRYIKKSTPNRTVPPISADSQDYHLIHKAAASSSSLVSAQRYLNVRAGNGR